jgi:hypothetical protein
LQLRRELQRWPVLHGGRASAMRNALRPRNARSRVRRYIRSRRQPRRPPVRAPQLQRQRPKQRFRHVLAPLPRPKRMTLRSPPPQAASSSRFPVHPPQWDNTPKMRRHKGRARALLSASRGAIKKGGSQSGKETRHEKARGRFLEAAGFFNSSDGDVMPVICPTRQIFCGTLIPAAQSDASQGARLLAREHVYCSRLLSNGDLSQRNLRPVPVLSLGRISLPSE